MATLTVNELALELNTDPRTTRKFLRATTEQDKQPGKGHRWQIEKKQLRSLKTQFAKYTSEHTRETPADTIDQDADELTPTS